MAATPRLLASAVVGGPGCGDSRRLRARLERAPGVASRRASLASLPAPSPGVVQDERGAGRRRRRLGARRDHGHVRRDRQRPVRAARRCRRVPTWCARTSAATWRPRTNRRGPLERAQLFVHRASSRRPPPIRTPPPPVTVLAAGPASVAGAADGPAPSTAAPGAEIPDAKNGADNSTDDDHGEVAWRLRHARRSILKDVTIPDDLLAGGHAERRVRPARSPRPRGLVGAPGDELLCRHALLRPGQPADDRLVRHAAAAVFERQLRARRRLPVARRAGRPARRLVDARRADAGRHLVVDRGRRVHHARAGAAPLRHRPVLQHAALRRRQRRRAARRHRRQPQRRRDLRLRHLHDRPGPGAHVRRDLRALRLPRRRRSDQPARRADRRRRPSTSASARARRAARSRRAPKNSCRRATPGSGCRRSARSRRSSRTPARAERTNHVEVEVERDIGPAPPSRCAPSGSRWTISS